MKQFLRSQFERHAPALFNAIRAVRNRRAFRRRYAPLQAAVRQALYPEGAAIAVQQGPFAGMRYFDETVWGSITPKWLGCYEAELHPVIGRLAARTYETVIDVGCAEGYYAIGLALMLPAARVFAFDTDFISRRQAQRLAQINHAGRRVEIASFCRHADLERLVQGRTLVVCDIEGSEAVLLDPVLAPSLLRCDLLVEVHESSASSSAVEQLLRARFGATHELERISAAARAGWIAAHRAEITTALSDSQLEAAADESRATGRVWLWLQAGGIAAA